MRLEANKAVVLEVYAALEGPRPFPPSLASHFAPGFKSIHIGHPTFTGTGEEYIAMFESILKPADKFTFVNRRIIAEDDQVWIWAEVDGLGPKRESVDIFMFNQDGKIIEKVDVQQAQV